MLVGEGSLRKLLTFLRMLMVFAGQHDVELWLGAAGDEVDAVEFVVVVEESWARCSVYVVVFQFHVEFADDLLFAIDDIWPAFR